MPREDAAQIFRTYNKSLYNVALRLTASPADSEEIVQAGGVAKVDFNATEKATYTTSGQATVRPHGKDTSVKIENGKTTVRTGYDD